MSNGAVVVFERMEAKNSDAGLSTSKKAKPDYVALDDLHGSITNTDICHLPFPLHHAAKYGKVDQLKELLSLPLSDEKYNIFTTDSKDRTPLHWAACVGNHKLALRCVKLMLECDQLAGNEKDKSKLVDMQDINGETCIHLSAKNESKKITQLLLYAGGDVNIMSSEGLEPMHLIFEKIPDVMVNLFDDSITAKSGEPNDENLVVSLDLGTIIGRPSESDLQREESYKLPVESSLLAYALHSSDYPPKDILTHPLVQIFLHLKWKRIRVLFYSSILFHIFWLILYTMLVVDVYLKSCPYIPDSEMMESNSNDTNTTERIIVRRHAGKSAGGIFRNGESNTDSGEKRSRFTWFGEIFSEKDENLEIVCDLNQVNMVTTYALLIITLLIAAKEVFEFSKVPKKIKMYCMRLENMGQWLLITSVIMSCWPVFSLETTMPEWQYQTAAFGIFLAWTLILSQIGKLPKLGIFVEMLVKVLKSFTLFILTFASLLIAFALSLSILIPGKPAFSSLPLAVLKVLIMMIGELNYDEVFHGDEEITPFPIAGHILFAIFAIMVTIILINLLIGFTVSDIQGLQHDAEVTALSGKLEQIFLMESFLLSDRMQEYLGCCNRTSFLERFLVTNPVSNPDDMRVELSIKKIPIDLKKEIRRLVARNSVPEDIKDVTDENREKLKNLLKTITNEILSKWEF